MPVRDLLSAASTQGAATADPYFYYNTLLLNGDGTNGAQNNTFLDSSTNNFTITRNGNTTQGSFSPYGTLWSNYIPSGSFFTAPDNSVFDFGAGNFTIEGWANFTSTSGTQNIVCRNYANSTGFILSNVNFLANITTDWDVNITFSSGFTANTWQHFAVVRNGNVFTCYINGNSVGTQTISGTIQASSGDVNIGRRNGQSGFAGYMSNLRIVKGTAVYTTTFTPPLTPLTAISGTSILTCQANRFIDSSSNNFTITLNGTPTVQRFSPFNPTAPYSTSVIGGSGYFPGNSNYLQLTPTSNTVQPTSSFTLEFFVYPTIVSGSGPSGTYSVCTLGSGVSQSFSYGGIQYTMWFTENNVYFGWYNNSGGLTYFGSSSGLSPNQWYHLAIGYDGTTTRFWVNGVSVASSTTGYGVQLSTSSFRLGGDNAASVSECLQGFMGDARFVRSDVYGVSNTNITVPTAPLTAISNTQFLGNYTNAGIPDLAMQNNLETVGNAQVSTSVKKYGTGSLAFDGSGDYLLSNAPSSNLYAFGTGNFTIEMWIYPTVSSGGGVYQAVYDSISVSASPASYPRLYVYNGGLQFIVYGTVCITGGSVSLNTWQHIALCRSSNSTKLFLNGNQVGSTFTDTYNYVNGANRPCIAGSGFTLGTEQFAGYIDDLRVTNGYARYTANFTPPTAALPTY
jgi:hypothetical protein